jgi:hypothetical protein
MTIERTVAIPADRRLVIEVPETFASDSVSIILVDAPRLSPPEAGASELSDEPRRSEGSALPETKTLQKQREAIKKCLGIARDFKFSSDDLLRNRREDLALEDSKWQQIRHQTGNK